MAGRTSSLEVSPMTEPKNSGAKTLGVKLPAELHAQFALVAQLDGLSLNDAVLRAVELYVESKRAAGDFAARATAALDEIEREAAARRAAIEGLLGSQANTPGESPAKPQRSRRGDPTS
jgi:hypothetical protein